MTTLERSWSASIRSRLLALLLVSGGVLILLTGLALRFSLDRWLEEEFDTSLATRISALATLAEQDFEVVELELVDGLLPEYESLSDPAYFEMWLDDGTVVERSDSLAGRDLPRFSGVSNRLRFADMVLPDGRPGRRVQLDFVPQLDDDLDLPLALPLDPELLEPGLGLHSAVLVIAWNATGLESNLARVDRLLLLSGVLLLLLLGLTVPWALRLGLGPLEMVGTQVEGFGVESIHRRIELARPPAELKPVIAQINGLLDRIETAFERERRLSSDLAHELRTPIAELKNLAEVGQRWPDDRDSVRRYFTDVHAVAEQMSGIVTNLLALARSESGHEVVTRSRFDVAEVLDGVLDRFEGRAAERDLSIAREGRGRFVVESDRGKLELILTNLVSNAVAYSPPGAVVETRIGRSDGEVVVAIANPAPDLEDADLPHLFERFWRKDQARTGGQHVGLGLTLVKSSADLLGLELGVELTPDRRLRFVLPLPLAAE